MLNLNPLLVGRGFRAKDEIRTRDPDLGKVVLYQLSYFRVFVSANIDRKVILSSDFLIFYWKNSLVSEKQVDMG